jgi:hypothetical protein
MDAIRWYILTELQTEFIEFWKIKQFDDVGVLVGYFTDGIADGFKTKSSYSDVTLFTIRITDKLRIDIPTEWFRWWFHRQN